MYIPLPCRTSRLATHTHAHSIGDGNFSHLPSIYRPQVLFMYMVLPARTNLLLDDDYCDFVYATPRGEYQEGGGLSLNDYWISCVEDRRFKPYFSKSHVVNAFMASPTTLLYTAPCNERNFAKMRDLGVAHVSSWLDLLESKRDSAGVMVKDIDAFETQVGVATRAMAPADWLG
jgi:hypothetical protein